MLKEQILPTDEICGLISPKCHTQPRILMKKLRHILIGIDFSPASRAALRVAMRLAVFNGATLTAVHIIDPGLADALKKANGFNDEQLLKSVEDSVYRFLSESECGPGMIKLQLAIEHPLSGIISACKKVEADLLVLGTHGAGREVNRIGAIAAKCIRKAPSDVLLVREDAGGFFQRALVCVDYSAASARAVSKARGIAECDGTALDFVFAYVSPTALAINYGAYFPPLQINEQAEIARCKNDLDIFVTALLGDHGRLKWNSSVLEGASVRGLLVERAKKDKADLVIIGTRGKSVIRDLVIGTTAEAMLRYAACSILAVKPEQV